MVTLFIIGILLFVGISIIIGLISVIGVIFTGVAAIALDVVVGLLPFILVYWVWKKFFKKGDSDG